MSKTYVKIEGSRLEGRYYNLTTVPLVGDKFEDGQNVVEVVSRIVTSLDIVIIKCKDV